MGNNIIDVNMDYNAEQNTSNDLAMASYATSVFKDCGFTDDQIWSALELIFGHDIRPDGEAFKAMKFLLDETDNYEDFMIFYTMFLKKSKLI